MLSVTISIVKIRSPSDGTIKPVCMQDNKNSRKEN